MNFKYLLFKRIFLLLIVAQLSATHVFAATILYDESHGIPAYVYSMFDDLVTNNGYDYSVYTGSEISDTTFQGADIFMMDIQDLSTSYSTSEITAINNFVNSGGGLLMLTDVDDHSQAAEPIMQSFGMTLTANVSTSGHVIADSSLTTGVTNLTLDPYAKIVTSNNDGFSSILSSDGISFAATMESGSGRIAYFGDGNIFMNWNMYTGYSSVPPPLDPTYDNYKLALNTVEWLSNTTPVVPEPVSSILFVAGGTLFAGRNFVRKCVRKKRSITI